MAHDGALRAHSCVAVVQVVGHYFGDQEPTAFQRDFPYLRDATMGAVPNLALFPEFRNWTNAQLLKRFQEYAPAPLQPYAEEGVFVEGLLPHIKAEAKRVSACAVAVRARIARRAYEHARLRSLHAQSGKHIWHPLDARYDGVVGNCRALDEPTHRNFGPDYYSVHFTCMPTMPHVHKPGDYASDYACVRPSCGWHGHSVVR